MNKQNLQVASLKRFDKILWRKRKINAEVMENFEQEEKKEKSEKIKKRTEEREAQGIDKDGRKPKVVREKKSHDWIAFEDNTFVGKAKVNRKWMFVSDNNNNDYESNFSANATLWERTMKEMTLKRPKTGSKSKNFSKEKGGKHRYDKDNSSKWKGGFKWGKSSKRDEM